MWRDKMYKFCNFYAQADTIVVSKTIPDEIAAFEFRQKEYFLVAGKDTSGLSCILLEKKIAGGFLCPLNIITFI